jgi:sulfur-oxidizing protein SoxY
MPRLPNRRRVLALGTGSLAAGSLATIALRPVAAEAVTRTETTAQAIRRFAGDAEIRPGRVHLDLPPLVENGNAVTITVTVDSPMSGEDHVRRIAVFNDKNPQANVITVHLGPRAGRAAITTRIRLADTQRITAIAETSDGRYWSTSADAIVTLAACLEG